MDDKVILALFSGLLGFALSQLFNLIEFVKRPRFRVCNFNHGVTSSYTGDPPETPWEIDLGFYLENHGMRPAKNTRVFVSDFKTSIGGDSPFEGASLEFRELKRPVDVIPPRESVSILFGRITGETHSLKIRLHEESDAQNIDFSEADSREKRAFSAKFFVTCDDKSSMDVIYLEFRPDRDDWTSEFITDYDIYSVPTGPVD